MWVQSIVLAAAILSGRVSGLFRDFALARNFGVSRESDIAFTLLALPDLLTNILLSGGLVAALIPSLRNAGQETRRLLFWQCTVVVALTFSVPAATVVALPRVWFALLAPGVRLEDIQYQLWILGLVACAIPLTAVSAVTTAVLNSEERYLLAGCGTLFYNITIILLLPPAEEFKYLSLLALSTGILVGAGVRYGSQLIALGKSYRQSLKIIGFESQLTGGLMRAFVSGLSATSIVALLPMTIRAFASLLGEGKLTAFAYSIKLAELPSGVLATALVTTLYTKLCDAFCRNDQVRYTVLLNEHLQRSYLLATSVSLCGLQFVDLLVPVVLGFRGISQTQLLEISQLCGIAMLSVPWVCSSSILLAAHNARNNSTLVVRSAVSSVVVVPIFAFPAVMMNSPSWLMGTFPAFLVVFSIMLWRVDKKLQTLVSLKPLVLPSIGILVMFLGLSRIDNYLNISESYKVLNPVCMRFGYAGISLLLLCTTGLVLLKRAHQKAFL